MKRDRRGPEVLAPAGGPECLPAAVAGGADAVYLGLRHFNARGRAENFRLAELPRHVEYLHRHGLKCYVVLNTLVHDDEFPKALRLAQAAHAAGVDAAIIQDLGLWRLLAREVPGLERHASTQQTIHDPSQLAVIAGLGARRVVLARELDLAGLRRCCASAKDLGIEIEHFVHGALCYAYSGQCLMSNFAGQRSANRGTCAQNCRFDYGCGDAQPETVLSMKDLALASRIGDLASAGVHSLKIEGRLKGPEYVYTTSRIYRAAVDAWAAGKPFDRVWAEELMRDVFSRANDDSPLAGRYGQEARLQRYAPDQDRTPDARLVSAERSRGALVVDSTAPITPGQGFACTVGDFNDGFLVTHARQERPGRWQLTVRIDPRGPRLPAGLSLFRNADHARKREAAAAMAAVPLDAVPAGVRVDVRVSGSVGTPLVVSALTADGRQAEATSAMPLVAAQAKPVDDAALRDSLGAFGGSPFRFGSLINELRGDCFMPVAALKALRRTLVEALIAQPVREPAEWEAPAIATPRLRTTALWVAVSTLDAARAALDAGAAAVWLDDPTLDLWGATAPELPHLPGLWLRHPATAPLSPHLATIGLPVVAGHLGVLVAAHGAGMPVIADVFCNAYSSETLAALHALGAEAAVLSLELSAREIGKLAGRLASTPAPAIAVTVHGRLPAMLTRQQHGLALGAVGTIQAIPRDGGLPYELQRRQHDTVVWEGRRLCAPEDARHTVGLVDAWVLELGDLDPAAVATVVGLYAGLRDGVTEPAVITTVVEELAPHGLFSGHLHRGSRELDELVPESRE